MPGGGSWGVVPGSWRGGEKAEQTCKPHSVEGGHLSWDPDCSGPLCTLPGNELTNERGGQPKFPAWACSRKSLAFSLRPYPALVSVPLVLASRRTGVTRYLVLWSADFPHARRDSPICSARCALTTEVVAGKERKGPTDSCSCRRGSFPGLNVRVHAVHRLGCAAVSSDSNP